MPAGGAGTGAVRAVALSLLSRLVLVLHREKSELQPLDLEEGERNGERERDVCVAPCLLQMHRSVAGAACGSGGCGSWARASG